MCNQRRGTTKEKPGVVWFLASAFFGVVEIVQAQADDLSGARHWRGVLDICQWNAGSTRCHRSRGRSAHVNALPQRCTQIGRHLGLCEVQVDHAVSDQHAEPNCALLAKAYKSHENSS